MIRARFRLTLSDDLWVTAVSTTHPDATLRLLTGVPMGTCALELGEVRAADPRAVADAIRNHADIAAYEEVYGDDERVIARYEAFERGPYEFLWESSLPPEFPMVVEDGEMEFDLTATQAQFDAFGEALDETGRPSDLISVAHAEADESLLTERQFECLRVAHRRGFFEVPRRCTVAEVADALGVDTSTASETIRRATGRLVDQFFVARD